MISVNVFSRRLSNAILKNQNLKFQAARSMTVLSKETGEEYKKLNYSERMKKAGRPVSPCVTVFAFPLIALSSITCRITGVVLSVGACGLGAFELFGGTGTALWLMQTIGAQGPVIATFAKFGVAFPLTYHYGGALRHIMWEFKPELLTNEDVHTSSYYLIGGSIVCTSMLMAM